MKTKYRQGFVDGTSECATSVPELLNGRFDFMFCVSSWDRRCLSITESIELSAQSGCLVLFDVKDDSGLRDKHDAALRAFCAAKCDKHEIIQGDSADTKGLWRAIEDCIKKAYAKKGKPLSVVVDLCTCPRFFALAIMSRGLKTGMISRLVFFYAEGVYPEETSEEVRHELFTSGGWRAVPIPGLEGRWEPGNSRFNFVSVGFEGAKTLRLVTRLEPDRVSVLFPDPGVQGEYIERARKNNEALFERYSLRESDIFRAHAGDAIAAWREMGIQQLERSGENASYLCCGTKAHSLALGIRALVLKCPAVLYIVPDRHNVVDVRPGGVFWRYDVQDITAIDEVS